VGMGLIQEAFAVPSDDRDLGAHIERPYTENLIDDDSHDQAQQPGFYTSAADSSAADKVTQSGGPAPARAPSTRPAKAPRTGGSSLLVGVLSDTHGKLDPAIIELFSGCDHIIHAGDVGDHDILAQLGALAPVTAVRGNCDKEGWTGFPEASTATFDGIAVHVRHDLVMAEAFDVPTLTAMRDADRGVVICGHTHQPFVEHRAGVLYLNPGSASIPPYERPRSVALPVSDCAKRW
jgi:putative phosphoesterase